MKTPTPEDLDNALDMFNKCRDLAEMADRKLWSETQRVVMERRHMLDAKARAKKEALAAGATAAEAKRAGLLAAAHAQGEVDEALERRNDWANKAASVHNKATAWAERALHLHGLLGGDKIAR